MAKQTINLGTGPNTKTGDPLRTAFGKINDNFTELYDGDNSTNYLTLTNTAYYAPVLKTPVTFNRPNGQPNTVDNIGTDLTIKRAGNNGIFNSALEGSWNSNQSPLNTEWNSDGWASLETEDVTQRSFTSFYEASKYSVGSNVVNYEYVMHDITNDKYYKVDFNFWQPGGGGQAGSGVDSTGGFSYTRTEIDTTIVKNFNRAWDNDITDNIDTGLQIGRDSQGGIYNRATDEGWDADVTPTGTLWNADGWNDLSNLVNKTWKPFFAAVHGQLGNHVLGLELLMKDTINNKYYKVKFTDWGQNNGGSFAYTRRRIKASDTEEGIYFADGSVQKTAFNRNVASKSYSDTIVELDTNATVNKILPTTNSGAPHYHLADGIEGQVMYIVPKTGGETNYEYTVIQIDHARFTNSGGGISEYNNSWWLPFRGEPASLVLVFSDGAWVLPHNHWD
jgi:hypothetical protein